MVKTLRRYTCAIALEHTRSALGVARTLEVSLYGESQGDAEARLEQRMQTLLGDPSDGFEKKVDEDDVYV